MKKIEEFIECSYGANLSSIETFSRLVGLVMVALRLLDKDLAHEFSASRATVAKWRSGGNAPHLSFRRHIIEWMNQQAKRGIMDRKKCVENAISFIEKHHADCEFPKAKRIVELGKKVLEGVYEHDDLQALNDALSDFEIEKYEQYKNVQDAVHELSNILTNASLIVEDTIGEGGRRK